MLIGKDGSVGTSTLTPPIDNTIPSTNQLATTDAPGITNAPEVPAKDGSVENDSIDDDA